MIPVPSLEGIHCALHSSLNTYVDFYPSFTHLLCFVLSDVTELTPAQPDSPGGHCCIFVCGGSCVWKRCFLTFRLSYRSTIPLPN